MLATAIGFILPLGALGLLLAAAAAFAYLPMFGKQTAVALLIAAAAMFAYDLGYRERGALDKSAEIKKELAIAEAEKAEAERQAAAAASIAADARSAERLAEGAAAINQRKVDDYVAQLAKRTDCLATDDDARRLLDYAGGAAAAAEPAAGPGDLRPAGPGAGPP